MKNQIAFKSVLQTEIRAFRDPGLINTVNSYRGEAIEENLGAMARISENKYLFSGEFILLKFIQQLSPPTFFTPQEKLLSFSFSPPIFLGFIIPFFYGIYLLLKTETARKIIITSTLLVIPSVLAKAPVDLNRLVIFMPVILFVIAYGLIKLMQQKNNKLIYITILTILVIFQMLVTFSDIKNRERNRFEKYYGQNYEVKEL
jgi:hypothetical protein